MNIVGIDLGGTRIKIGIVGDNQVKASTIIDSSSKDGLKVHLPLIKSKILELQQKTQINDIVAVGMAFPGIVDTVNSRVIGTSEKYNDAPEVDLAQWAKEALGMQLRMDNDARLACIGEWKHGAGRGSTDMVMYTLGTGVGSAAIIDNKILRGKNFQAGILGGHFIIDINNNQHQCSCGNYGCVESIASTWMVKILAEGHVLYNKSLLSKAKIIDLATVLALSKNGDELSEILKEHCLNAWAIGLVNLIHAYDPEVVVIGGGIIHSKDIILPYFQKIVEEKAWCAFKIPEIRAALYPDRAALLGATALFE